MAQTGTKQTVTSGIWPELWQKLLGLLIAEAPVIIKWMAGIIASWFKKTTPGVTFQVVGEQNPIPGMTTITLTDSPVNVLVVSVNNQPVRTAQFVKPTGNTTGSPA